MRLMLIQTLGLAPRLRAFGYLPVEESERLTCALLPCRRIPLHVRPAAYAALALELYHAGDPNIGDGEVRWAIEHVTSEVREVLLQMPARKAGTSRLDKILYELDEGIRGRALLENA